MIITIGKGIEEKMKRAILEQDIKLNNVLLGFGFEDKEDIRGLTLQEYARNGEYFLCGPSRNPPEGFIYNPEFDRKKILEFQGQLFVGKNLITMKRVNASVKRGDIVSARGNTEAVIPIYSSDIKLRGYLVDSMIKLFRERFNVEFDGEPTYQKYIVYESSVERELVQDILKERYEL